MANREQAVLAGGDALEHDVHVVRHRPVPDEHLVGHVQLALQHGGHLDLEVVGRVLEVGHLAEPGAVGVHEQLAAQPGGHEAEVVTVRVHVHALLEPHHVRRNLRLHLPRQLLVLHEVVQLRHGGVVLVGLRAALLHHVAHLSDDVPKHQRANEHHDACHHVLRLSVGHDVAVADGGHCHDAPVEGHRVQVPRGGEVLYGPLRLHVVVQVVPLIHQAQGDPVVALRLQARHQHPHARPPVGDEDEHGDQHGELEQVVVQLVPLGGVGPLRNDHPHACQPQQLRQPQHPQPPHHDPADLDVGEVEGDDGHHVHHEPRPKVLLANALLVVDHQLRPWVRKC
mmetsp:Transcript_38244/g.83197  ORF Transcript_38244/g.83197 Transcript_38244/m.83197 type:complete len:339 (+) Transcript_38244:631-1647(+)